MPSSPKIWTAPNGPCFSPQPIRSPSTSVNFALSSPTFLPPILSPILFFAPELHHRNLVQLWNDRLVHEAMWKRFIERLQGEWDKYLLPVRRSCCSLFRVTCGLIHAAHTGNGVTFCECGCYIVAFRNYGFMLCRSHSSPYPAWTRRIKHPIFSPSETLRIRVHSNNLTSTPLPRDEPVLKSPLIYLSSAAPVEL